MNSVPGEKISLPRTCRELVSATLESLSKSTPGSVELRQNDEIPCQIPCGRETPGADPAADRPTEFAWCERPGYRPSAAPTSFSPSSLAHSAGPASEASSHPF